jgi:hypothetical protein
MAKKSPMAEFLPRFYSFDNSLLIGMMGVMLPRILSPVIESLDEKERRAFDKVMPPTRGKWIYVQLVGSPTPPIAIELAQPLRIGTMSEEEVKREKIRGIRLKCDDAMILAEGMNARNALRFFWHLRGQWITTLRIMWGFTPLLRLGRSGMKDVQDKMNARMEPLLSLFAT